MINVNILKSAVSTFKQPITNTEKVTDTNLEEIYKAISSEYLKEKTENYRKGIGGKKKDFPFVLFSGVFEGRKDKDLIEHSNLLAIDIDDVENIDEVKSKLKKDKYIALIYTTPSGKGLRAVIVIDIKKTSHLDYFLCAEEYFKQEYDLTIDKSCKNVSRASFLCYDPNAYLNINVLDFPFDNFQLPKLKGLQNNSYFGDLSQQKVEDCITQIIEKRIDITEDYENWLKIGFALANEFEEEGRKYYHSVSQFHQDYDPDKCDKQFDACISSNNHNDDNITIASFFHYCKEYGIEFILKNVNSKNLSFSTDSIITAKERLRLAKNLPPIKSLFGSFWATNQIGILFGDTGLGKSILAVQLADAISKGKSLFELLNKNAPLKTLLYDFELSDKQFEKRYSDDKGKSYEFSDNLLFKRYNIEEYYISKEKNTRLAFDEWLFQMLEHDVHASNSKVLIIDNITFLNSESTHDANIALTIMRRLKQLKDKLGISILVLAHTPKIPKNEPIIINNLAGSKQLSNFADSIFCIGKSGLGYDWCYLKQIKARDGIEVFNEDNVLSIWKEKKDCMLQFYFENYRSEDEHFIGKQDRESVKEQAYELNKKEGKSLRDIGDKFDVSHQTIKRWIDRYKSENEIT